MAMFDKAKTLKSPAKAKKSDKSEVVMLGLERVAALDAVIKSLTAVMKTEADQVKDLMADHFVEVGVETKKRPESFRGIEGTASASCELRARAVTSALTDDEAALLTAKGISIKEVVGTVDTYVINPAYLEDPRIMGSIELALKKIKGIPDDLFLHQEGTSKTVVAEGAIDELFAKGDADLAADLLPIVSVLAIKPKMETDDMAAAFAIVQKLIVPVKAAA